MTLMDGSVRSAGLHRRRGQSWRMHAAPVQTFEQRGELGGRQVNDAVLRLGPAELAILQSLGDENHLPTKEPLESRSGWLQSQAWALRPCARWPIG
jgi:hypothetical protein